MLQKEITSTELYISLILFTLPPTWWYFHLPGKHFFGDVIFIIPFIYYAQNKKFQHIAISFPLVIWMLLTVYHFVNGICNNVPSVDVMDLIHGFKIYACIVIVAYWACIDFKKTTRILIISFLARCLVGLLLTLMFGGMDFDDRMTGMGGSATQTGQAAAITGVFIVYYNVIKKCDLTKNILLFSIPFMVVILTQSRNSLAMLLISVFTTAIMYANRSRKMSIVKSLLASFLLIALMYLSLSLFMESAFMERAISVTEKSEHDLARYYSTGTIFDTILGDRIVYYITGWRLFLTKPLTGIGMWNYLYLTHGVYPLHSEYMVHLCEGGIIGFTIWSLFNVTIFWIIIKKIKEQKLKVAALSSMFVLLFCGLYAREFFSEWFFPVYGLIISFLFRKIVRDLKKYIIRKVI